MSTWMEQLSTWMEDQEPIEPPQEDLTVQQIETLIDISHEIQEAYTQVVEKLTDERNRPLSETKNR